MKFYFEHKNKYVTEIALFQCIKFVENLLRNGNSEVIKDGNLISFKTNNGNIVWIELNQQELSRAEEQISKYHTSSLYAVTKNRKRMLIVRIQEGELADFDIIDKNKYYSESELSTIIFLNEDKSYGV